MRNSSVKLLQNQLQTAKKELSVRSSEIVKLRASVQDLTDQIKLCPVSPDNSASRQQQPNYQKPTVMPVAAAGSVISESGNSKISSTNLNPLEYYRDQVRMLQERLQVERKQHEKDRKRWDSEKTNVLNYQNQLQDQYTHLVDAFAQQSINGSTLSVVNNTKHL